MSPVERYAELKGYSVRKGYELCRVLQNKLEYLFGFEAADWLFLAGGVALTAVVAAVIVF